MKKTVSVNIKGLNFLIEEDAYELLQDYMDRLNKTLKNEDGSKEIIEDVELRIAELCSSKLTDSKTVIELEDIQTIIAALGSPEDYVDGEEFSNSDQNDKFTQTKTERRLFRDTEDAAIAGVCRGIANYFDIDVVIVRAIFVVIFLFAGFGVPLYVILWIIIPKAKTSIDRLRMKGRPITVESVKNEVEDAAEKFKSGTTNLAKRIRRDTRPHRRFSRLGRVISTFFGFGFIAISIVFLILFLVFVIGGAQVIPIQSDNGFLSMSEFGSLVLANSGDYSNLWIGGILCAGGGILFTLLIGVMLLFRIRNKWASLSLLGLFLTSVIGFFICVSIGMSTAGDLIIEGEIETKVGEVRAEQLTIVPEQSQQLGNSHFNVMSDGHFGPLQISGNDIVLSGVRFEYIQSPDSLFHIKQKLSARSKTHKKSLFRSQNIKHDVAIKGDSLLVDGEYSFPKTDKIRDQRVTIEIAIPEGSQVKFDNRIIKLGEYELNSKIIDPFYHEKGHLRRDGRYHHDEW